jgi:CBS-domain-containing membrane protein
MAIITRYALVSFCDKLCVMLEQHDLDRVKRRWREYLASAGYCAVVLFLVQMILGLQEQVIIASIGATAFVVLAMPKSHAARITNTVGGHMIGLLSGSLAAMIPHSTDFAEIMVNSVAVGLCAFAMLATRYKHPPAAGTALGVAISGISISVGITVIASVLALSIIRIASFNLLYDFMSDDEPRQ